MKPLLRFHCVLGGRCFLWAAAALLYTASLSTAQHPESNTTAVPKIKFEKYTLPNGAQVILHVDNKLPMVHVNQWYYVGSANERVGRSGFAHLFEHMMFQGSKHADKYFPIVETMGANLFEGAINGTTNWDRTNYFATVPSASLEALLWLEADRLATLPEGINQEKLDNQREVVKNERRQGLENQPYGRAFKLMCENLYPARHPYANDVIGSHEDLTAASMEDVKDFFRTYYTPNNLSLVIAGDFDPVQAKKLVEKYFGTIPAGPALDRPVKWIPKMDGTRTIETTDRVPQERVYMAWQSPAFFESGDADMDLISLLLTDGLSSRLNKALVYDRQLCSDTVSFQLSRPLGSMFIVWATARPGTPLPTVEKGITEEIARLAKDGPSEAELNRAKTKWEYQFVTGLERIGGFGGKADLLNQYNTFLGDPDKFEQDITRHRNITVGTIRQTTARWLATPDMVLVRFHPEKSQRETQVAIDRSEQPPLGPDRPYEAPRVHSVKLDNGLELLVMERHDLPKVSVTLATRAGSVRDPQNREGLADLTAYTTRFGTRSRKAIEIDDAVGDLGTSISGGAGTERAGISMDVLKRNLAPALAIFADVVRDADFPESEIVREKKLRHDSLEQESKDPNGLAQRIGPMLAFGADHPYGRPRRGLPSTVDRITREDLLRFHAEYWKPATSALIFAGDLSLDEAMALARANFGTWSGGAAEIVQIPAPRPMGTGKTYVVDRQDAAQTVVAEILPAPPRKGSDYYPFRLADTVWGGAGKARLDMNLREEKGYSYGVFSFPQVMTAAGAWIASGGVQTNKTKESVVEFRKELLGIAGDKPVSEKELADAKALRVRSYAQQFESLGRVTGQIAYLWEVGLPMSELQREPAELDGATLDSVNAAARKYARVDGSTLLLVGDWAKIQVGIRELELGPVVVLDEEGKTKGN
jgi:zinc protease